MGELNQSLQRGGWAVGDKLVFTGGGVGGAMGELN